MNVRTMIVLIYSTVLLFTGCMATQPGVNESSQSQATLHESQPQSTVDPVDASCIDRDGVSSELKALSTDLVEPVDADGDGVIDVNDVLLLMGKFNDHWKNRIQPFLYKAGIKTDKIEHVPPDALDQLQRRLSYVEYNELQEAWNELRQLGAQVEATKKDVFPNWEKLEEIRGLQRK